MKTIRLHYSRLQTRWRSQPTSRLENLRVTNYQKVSRSVSKRTLALRHHTQKLQLDRISRTKDWSVSLVKWRPNKSCLAQQQRLFLLPCLTERFTTLGTVVASMTTTLEVNSHMAKNLQSMVASLASKIIQVSKASGLWSHLPSYCRQIRRLWRIRHRQHLTFHREKLRMQELTIRSLLLQEPLSLQAWLKELSKAWTETGRHQLNSVNSLRKVSKENSWLLVRQS